MSQEENCSCHEGDCECGHGCSCDCDCCHADHFHRRFQTKAEQIADLESYLQELRLEVQAVEEHLADLRK